MSNFTIDMAAKSENLDSSSIIRLYKQIMMLKIIKIKSNKPRLTQKQISNQLGYSDSTIKRYRDDIQMDSPYKRNKNRKKNNKPSTTITETHTTNGSTKNIKKNDLKGGSFLENNPEDNTKFITLARKMIDNN